MTPRPRLATGVIPIGLLERLSLFYIILPYFIFAFGWLQPVYAVIFCLLLTTALYLALKSFCPESFTAWRLASGTSRLQLILILCLVIAWVSLSGAGGIGYQNTDRLTHNAMLKDLILHDWPVIYPPLEPGATPSALVFYIAFLLPSALIGKLFGWPAANYVLFVWTLLGTLLAVLWFSVFVRKQSLLLVVPFVVFSGMDLLGYNILTRGHPPEFTEHIEFWAGFRLWQYSSNTTLLFWVPQHAFIGWIATALAINEVIHHRSSENLGLILGASLLWSPLVSIGLLPVIAVGLCAVWFRRVISFQNVVLAPFAALIMLLFYSAKGEGIPQGFVWNFTDMSAMWPRLLLFSMLEFGVYAVLCAGIIGSIPTVLRSFFLASLVCLALLPWYKFGRNNDLLMRASIPSLFVLWIVVGRVLVEGRPGWYAGLARALLGLGVLIGGLTAAGEIGRSVVRYSAVVPDFERTPSVLEARPLEERPEGEYTGSPEALFFRYLARKDGSRRAGG
jgi:hypothetical protein